MRLTHFELFKAVIGDRFKYLEGYFQAFVKFDIEHNKSVPEFIFNQVFNVDICKYIFGTPDLDRSNRAQRKMDLAVIRQIYHLWKDKNYFDLSPKLCPLIASTDLVDVDTFFLQAPYRSMYLSLPKGSGFFIPNAQTGLHEVDGIYITFDDFKGKEKLVMPGKNIEGATKHMHMVICGENKGVFGDAILFFDLLFFEGKISDSIKRNREILDNPNHWDYIVNIFNFVTKVLLYINCSNVSILKVAGMDIEEKLRNLKNPAKKRKLIKKYGKISSAAHKILDVSISLNPDSSGFSEGTRTKLKPKSLEKVRRHFKTQRYGQNYSQSKIIVVESYLRGEGAEYYRKIYKHRVS